MLLAGAAAAHDEEPPAVDCLTGGAVPELQFGAATKNCSLAAPGETDAFTFALRATDDVVRVILVADPFLDPRLVVRDPLGNPLHEVACHGGTAPGPAPACVLETDLDPLPGAPMDVYGVEIHDEGGDETGAYQLQIEILPAPDPSEFILINEPSFIDFAVLETVTDLDQVAFGALQNERVRVAVEASRFNDPPSLDPRVEILAPDGTVLASDSCEGDELAETGCTTAVVATLPALDVYGFAISDVGHDDAGPPLDPAFPPLDNGRYTYRFERLPEPSAGALGLGALATLALLRRAR